MAPGTGTGLAGRVAIVTGAGQGIGRAFAHALAKTGAIPVIGMSRSMARELGPTA